MGVIRSNWSWEMLPVKPKLSISYEISNLVIDIIILKIYLEYINPI